MKKILKWTIVALAIFTLVGVIAFGGAFYYLFKVYPEVDLPASCGAQGPNFEIRCQDDVPYLWMYSLPYPTDYQQSNRPRISLNGTWKMRFDRDEVGETQEWYKITEASDPWFEVPIPSTYNSANSRFVDHRGITWYITHFNTNDDGEKDEIVRLCFRGILLRSKVWLNGKLLGEREGGYTPFYFNITDYLKQDGSTNTLIVKADNRHTYTSLPPRMREDHSAGWAVYGGIYRDVYLEILPDQYIFKVMTIPYIAGEDSSIELVVMTHHMGEQADYNITAKLSDKTGIVAESLIPGSDTDQEINTHRTSLEVPHPNLWSPEEPNLYRLELIMETLNHNDRIIVDTGFRSIKATANELLLNNKPIYLRGICKHEDDPDLGATQTMEIIHRDLGLIKIMNANYIRMAHYPHNVEELNRARDLGLMICEEVAFYQVGMGWTAWFEEGKPISDFPITTFGMRQMHDDELLLNTQRELIEMVERDRNNPAIILWGVGNESYSLFDEGGEVYGWFNDIVKAFDETRLTTFAEITYDIPFFDNLRTASDYVDVASINSYYGWYYGEASQISEHLDSFHSMFPNKPVILSEFGASAKKGRHTEDGVWVAERVAPGKTYSEEYQKEVIEKYLYIVQNYKPYVVGTSPWVYSDFYCPWFPNNPEPYYNLKGVVNKNRVPKQSYYLLMDVYAEMEE